MRSRTLHLPPGTTSQWIQEPITSLELTYVYGEEGGVEQMGVDTSAVKKIREGNPVILEEKRQDMETGEGKGIGHQLDGCLKI